MLRTLSAGAIDPVPESALRFAEIDPSATTPAAANGDATREPLAGQRLRSERWTTSEPRRPADAAAGTTTSPAPAQPSTGAPARDAAASAARGDDDAADALTRRFLGAIAHEIRNPLVPIRTLAQLLPQRFDDPEFRNRFAQQVGSDVERITGTLDRMAGFAALGPPIAFGGRRGASRLLDAHRRVQSGAAGLEELDRTQPNVPADDEHLRFAFSALLDKALSLMPDRGDLYLASKHHDSGLRGLPSVRILLRYHSPHRIAPLRDEAGVSLAENTLELVIAETLVRGLGGRLTIDSTDGEETVLVVDLPA